MPSMLSSKMMACCSCGKQVPGQFGAKGFNPNAEKLWDAAARGTGAASNLKAVTKDIHSLGLGVQQAQIQLEVWTHARTQTQAQERIP